MQNWIESEFFGYWKDVQSRITKCLSLPDLNDGISPTVRIAPKPATRLMSRWGESVVRQSLDLQSRWIDLWIAQFKHESVDLSVFTEQVEVINQAMHDWSKVQNELRAFWFSLLDVSLGKSEDSEQIQARIDTWKKVVQESETDLNRWFTKWEEQINCKPLVPDDLHRLIEKLGQEMLGWIQNQAVLWQYGFHFLKGGVLFVSEENKESRTHSASSPDRDNLKEIAEIGPLIEQLLNAQNIVNFRQIANLSEEEIRHLENKIKRFPSRIRGRDWVREAKELCTRE